MPSPEQITRDLLFFIVLLFVARVGHASFLELDSIYRINQQEEGIQSPADSVITSDDKFVYVLGLTENRVNIYARSATDKSLVFSGSSAVLKNDSSSVYVNNRIVLSPAPIDGNRLVYVLSNAKVPGSASGFLTVFYRDSETGSLSYIDSLNVSAGSSLSEVFIDLAVSPDGGYLYALARATNTVSVFKLNIRSEDQQLNPTLELAQLASDKNTSEAFASDEKRLAVSPDGNYVYETDSKGGRIHVFRRNSSDGHLEYLPALMLHNDQVEPDGDTVTGLSNPGALQISKDGRFAYVTSVSDRSIVVLNRDISNGSLDFNVSYSGGGAGGFNYFEGLEGITALYITPDNGHLVVLNTGSLTNSAISAFVRNTINGALQFIEHKSDDLTGSMGITGAKVLMFSRDSYAMYSLSAIENAGQIGIYDNCLINPITADAGQDLSVLIQNHSLIHLSAAGSKARCGELANYQWVQVAGEEVHLLDPDTSNPSFLLPADVKENAVFVFRLTVSNNLNHFHSDDVVVTVTNTCTGALPVANAGKDFQVANGSSQVVWLDGSQSKVSCGSISSYSWQQLDGPDVNLSGVDTATPVFVSPRNIDQNTNLLFQLTIKTASGASSSDMVQVSVIRTKELDLWDKGYYGDAGYGNEPVASSSSSIHKVTESSGGGGGSIHVLSVLALSLILVWRRINDIR